MQNMSVRAATDGDLDGLGRLSSRRRERLENYEPTFWGTHEAVDQNHRQWLGFLLLDSNHEILVAEDAGAITGFVIARPGSP